MVAQENAAVARRQREEKEAEEEAWQKRQVEAMRRREELQRQASTSRGSTALGTSSQADGIGNEHASGIIMVNQIDELDDERDGGDFCLICYESYLGGEDYLVPTCGPERGHMLHLTCASSWRTECRKAEVPQTCPMCREPMQS